MARKPHDIVHLKLRLPEFVRRRLEKEAQARRYSMNSEIIARLEWSFRAQDKGEHQDESLVVVLADRLAKALTENKEIRTLAKASGVSMPPTRIGENWVTEHKP